MPKYYCDYCDTYLTHDSPSVRKTHCTGRKHKDNVKFYYQKWMEEQGKQTKYILKHFSFIYYFVAQHLIDATTAAFKAGKIAQNPFAPQKAAIPPPSSLGGPPPRPGMMPGMPMMMGPHGPIPPPQMMGMRPPHMMGPMGQMMGPPPMGMRPPMGMGAPMKQS